MCRTTIFTCIVAMGSRPMITFTISVFKLFFATVADFWMNIWFTLFICLWYHFFFFIIIFIAFSFRSLQNFLIQILPLDLSYLFFLLPKAHSINIEQPHLSSVWVRAISTVRYRKPRATNQQNSQKVFWMTPTFHT